MNISIPYQSTLGLAFSIAGLALVAPVTFFFRTYSSSLDTAQLLYVFVLVLAPTSSLFSANLGASWLNFMPSFLNCNIGNYVCSYGYLLSALISWTGAVILLFIIFRLIAIKKTNLSYQPFYSFFRGFLRWTLPPLAYNSTYVLIKSLQSKNLNNDFISSIVVLGFLIFVAFMELIVHKCYQKKDGNIWKKWIYFLNHARIIIMMVLLVVSLTINVSAKYVLYAPILIYDIIYLFKYKFSFKVFERIIFILSESTLITIYSLFIFEQSYIIRYSLDFLALAFIIFLELFMLLFKMYSHCSKSGD